MAVTSWGRHSLAHERVDSMISVTGTATHFCLVTGVFRGKFEVLTPVWVARGTGDECQHFLGQYNASDKNLEHTRW